MVQNYVFSSIFDGGVIEPCFTRDELMSQTFVSHLECSLTGKIYPANCLQGLSDAGRPLLVRYDLPKLKASIEKPEFISKEISGFWRYGCLLPVVEQKNRISLGEVVTPLIPINQFTKKIRAVPGKVLVKDEGRLPTGSFKARGLALAVSMAKSFGVNHLAIPTNGNAGSAMAAYASKAGIRSTVLCPLDTPEINIREIQLQGAKTFLVNGLINDCAKVISEGKNQTGWFDVSTLKEPYRIEGKKTMGLELAEQFKWELPDVIFYPTGGGTGIIGMWKAFAELKELGWINCKLPRMISVQSTGCAPIVSAWEDGKKFAELWKDAHTVASGIRVPVAVGDFLILNVIRESGGTAIAVDDESIIHFRDSLAKEEGFLLCPEGAATLAAYHECLKKGVVDKDEKVVLFNCATGLKYPLPPVYERVDIEGDTIDYSRFVDGA